MIASASQKDDGYIYKTWTDYGSSDGSEQTTTFILNEDGWPISESWVEEVEKPAMEKSSFQSVNPI